MSKSDPTPSRIQEALAYVEQEVRRSLVASLAATLGDDSLQAETASQQAKPEDPLWFRQDFNPSGTGAVFLGFNRASAVQIGQKLLAASGLKGEDDDTALGRLKEALAQVGGALASSFSAQLKREISAGTLVEMAPDSPSANNIGISLKTASGELATVVVHFMPQLVDSLIESPATGLQKAPAGTALASANLPASTRNLDLLLDVEMPVSVSFGRAQLPLKDVIKLTAGSIVELDRAVSEPVEIIVNNAVIAHGEVVVVEGNFGVRITQIMSKQDRLRSLG
jgi:flagellar motor switch protein FliN/FliY